MARYLWHTVQGVERERNKREERERERENYNKFEISIVFIGKAILIECF